MKNNKKIFTIIFVALLIVVSIFAFFLMQKRPYKTSDSTIIAAEANISYLLEVPLADDFARMETKGFKFVEEGVNTAILHLGKNSNKILDKENKESVINTLIDECTSNNIQVFFSLDCEHLTNEEILLCAQEINKNYPVAAVVLNNYAGSNEEFETFKTALNKLWKDISVYANVNAAYFTELKDSLIFDGYICKDTGVSEYMALKNTYPETIFLLHHSTATMASDIAYLVNYCELDGAVVYQGNTEKSFAGPSYKLFEKLEEKPEFNFEVKDEFAVTYPTKNETTWYSGVFITGTGAKNREIFINGISYPAAADGTFGVYFELAEGENSIYISNGEKEHSIVMTRRVSASSGDNSNIKWDNSVRLEKGRIVKTTSALTSVLSDPTDDSSIIGGLPSDTTLVVQESVKIERAGKYTWAYKLSNGGYVLSSKVAVLDAIAENYEKPGKLSKKEIPYETINIENAEIYKVPHLIEAGYIPGENEEIITIKNTSKPAVFTEFTDSYLEVLFLDTTHEDFIFTYGTLYDDTIGFKESDAGVIVRIDFKSGTIQGFEVKTGEEQTEIYLKAKPKISTKDNLPLSGTTIMLDPGHGGTDGGALGVAYPNGPIEKELNLAVATMTKKLLESYGANVIMTREDDTFPSLDNRRDAISEHKPDLFIAFHHNSMDYSYNSTETVGVECYYFTQQSAEFAHRMCEEVAKSTGRNNRGAKNSYYYVTRTDVCPAVLMEYGFLINAQEYSEIYTDEMVFRAAYGTMQAVLKTLPN